MPPDFLIPGPYHVTFKKGAAGRPVDIATLKGQGLDEFSTIIGLGGKQYRSRIDAAFAIAGRTVDFTIVSLARIKSCFNQSIYISKSGEVGKSCTRLLARDGRSTQGQYQECLTA